MPLEFRPVTSKKALGELVSFILEAFSETTAFQWSVESLKDEIKHGWKVFAVWYQDDIVAAVLTRMGTGEILTKHTGVKLPYQGKGLSHQIKEWFEAEARSNGLGTIFNYCQTDHFRTIALNERHGYVKTGRVEKLSDDLEVIEWKKVLEKK